MTPAQPLSADIIRLLTDVLGLDSRTPLQGDSLLLGNVPELDSMGVLTVITALEDTFGITVHDEDISAATFESVASLCTYVSQQCDAAQS